jgi:lysine-N-methylase
LPQIEIIQPTYADSFRCIGSDCEDTCCRGWIVPVDQLTVEKYKTLPAGALHALIDASILLTPGGGEGSKPASFATIQMTAAKQCPLLSEERLCRIQAEFGEAFLPTSCATYPRIVRVVGNSEEKALTLSCPEAARLVLLNPALLSPTHRTITEPLSNQLPGGDTIEDARSLQSWFWSIRESVLTLIRNRTYQLWQRLFLLGVLCRQLEAIAKGEPGSPAVPEFLRDFEGTVASGAPRTALDTLPVERGLQLDVVLRLAGMLLHRSNVHARFVESVEAFTAGIGNGPGATFESLTANYTLAHDRFYAPFFDRYPYILENYLINTIFRCQFPFGREGMRPGSSPSVVREYVTLMAQFALMKGWLIGVAGRHREAFSTDHVVHTVQAVSKHFEHHVEFLNEAHALLLESQMDGERGAAILLRNA